jgi:hypothetical protein
MQNQSIVFPTGDRDARLKLNCCRQDEAVVIIRVFTDQIHTPGRLNDTGMTIKLSVELFDEIGYDSRFFGGHGIWFDFLSARV